MLDSKSSRFLLKPVDCTSSRCHGCGVGILLLSLVLVLLFPYRFDYDWGFFSTISILDIMLVLMLPILIIGVIGRGHLVVADKRVFIILLLPTLFAMVSLAWSINLSATFKSIVVYGAAVVTLLLTIKFAKSYSVVRLSLYFLVVAYTLIITAIFSYFPGSPLRPEVTLLAGRGDEPLLLAGYLSRLSHPFIGLSNSFATILAMLLPILLFISQAGFWQRSSWLAAVLVFAAILATGSRGVILAILVVYATVFCWRLVLSGRIPKRGIIFIIMTVGVASLFVFFNPIAQIHLMSRLSDAGIDGRFAAFATVFDVIRDVPLGVGSGVALSETSAITYTSVHNAYLQNLLWFGWVLGTILTVALLALPILVNFIRVHSDMGRDARRAMAMSISILLMINLSQASWEGSLQRVWIYFLIGLGLAMVHKADQYGLMGEQS